MVDAASGRRVAQFTISRPDLWHDGVREISGIEVHGEFTRDSSFFVITDRCEPYGTRVVATRTGKTLLLDSTQPAALSPDSRSLVAERNREAWAFDLPTMDWRCKLDCTLSDVVRPVFSPDSRLVGTFDDGDPWTFLFVDLQTGRLQHRGPDAQHIAHTLLDEGSQRVEINDPETGLPHHTIAFANSSAVQTGQTADGKTLVVVETAQPGEPPAWRKWLETILPSIRKSRDDPDSMILHVYDMATGGLIGEVHTEYSRFDHNLHMTNDRRRLLVSRQKIDVEGVEMGTVLECWDLPPARPHGKAAAVPLALGVLVLAGYYGWRRWRRPRLAERDKRATSGTAEK